MDLNRGKKLRVRGKYSPVGLDIGSYYIKMLQLKYRRGKIFLHNYKIINTPEKVVENGVVVAPDILAENLSWRFRGKKVNLAISGHNVIMRQIELPPMSSRELPEAIRWEAEKHIMMPVEEAVIDYLLLGERESNEGRLQQVLLVAVPRDVINSYMETVLALGLNPLAIEVQSLSLIRLLNALDQSVSMESVVEQEAAAASAGEQQSLLLLDIGWETTNFIVVDEGQYSFSRNLGVGCKEFVEQIAGAGAIERGEAFGLIDKEEVLSRPGAQQAADQLLMEVQRSLEFYLYQMQNRERKIGQVYLTGGGDKIKGLHSFLAKELQMEPADMNPFPFIQHDKRFIPIDLMQDASFLGVATGLALRGWLS